MLDVLVQNEDFFYLTIEDSDVCLWAVFIPVHASGIAEKTLKAINWIIIHGAINHKI